MRVQLSLTLTDLTDALHRITPLELHLDDEARKVLCFERPVRVQLVPGLGLRAETDMRIRWPILGIEIPVSVESAILLLIPELTTIEGRDVLVFSVRVEQADLKHLPAFVDERVVDKVNSALESDEARLRWRLLDVLSFALPMPERMHTPGRTFDLRAASADLEITDREVLLAVTYESHGAEAAGDARSGNATNATSAASAAAAHTDGE